MNFAYNSEFAEMTGGGGQYITESGAYFGKITRAQIIVAKTGTIGVEIDFEAQDGARANRIKVWTARDNGEPLPSRRHIDRLMALLSIKDVEGVPDPDGNEIFPAFCNRPIGVMLQKRLYYKTDGSGGMGYGFDLIEFIDAKTKQTFQEKKAGTPAKAYLAKIEDRQPDGAPSSKGNPTRPQPTDDNGGLPF